MTIHTHIHTYIPQEMLRFLSGYSSCNAVPRGRTALRYAMTQPISRLPLLLSASCGTAYDDCYVALVYQCYTDLETAKSFES